MRPLRFTVEPSEAGWRLDRFLASRVPEVSRSQLRRHIDGGAVTLEGKTARPSRSVRVGQVVEYLPPPPKEAEPDAEPIELAVVFEDEWIVVLDKPRGMVVHPAAGHQSGTLVNALLHHCPDLKGVGGVLRPGIVHRLDKDTSGLMVVTKQDRAHRTLAAQFKAHDIERRYLALVLGRPKKTAGVFDTPYGRHPKHRKRFSSRHRGSRRAVTHYRVLEPMEGASLVEARLETGRTHQVRVHFADNGHPVLGDPMYAWAPKDPKVRAATKGLGGQALHAAVLGFEHPADRRFLLFVADPPADMVEAIGALGGSGDFKSWRRDVMKSGKP
jgi:23S rRNA pseudouridine1911/1915/1917 synthase